ncbi:MAG: hypothetical protein HQK49_18730 [Oligoflexia bacterium]|nr:hypothetical protein [Oligoflexia bacterium]
MKTKTKTKTKTKIKIKTKTNFKYTFRLMFMLMVIFNLTVLLAADLKPPMDLPSAQVLPKGVRNIRYKNLDVKGNEKFDNFGGSQVLADPFFKEVTWGELLDPTSDEIDKGLLRGYLESNGYDLSQSIGTTTGAVSVAATAHVPIFAYGVSERVTLAIAVPVVKYKFNVATGFVKNDNLRKLTDGFAADGKTYEQGKFINKMTNPVATKLALFGYSPLEGEERTKLGDINLVAKYLVKKNDIWTMSVQGTLTLPTGKAADINKVVDVPGGDGQIDFGTTILNEFSDVIPNTVIMTAFGNTIQFEDKIARRVPYRQDSKLTPDIDWNTHRDLGEVFFAQAGIKYAPGMGFNFIGGWAIQYKEADVYSGMAYSADRYKWLEIETEQRMQTVQFGAGYSTLDLFKAKKFPVPLELNLNHSMVVSGKNVTKDALTSVEFVMFF